MNKIQPPESQIQEVLFELINRIEIDRRTMMLHCGVWGLTARISDLRKLGLNIISNEIKSVNKFGREIKFVHYSLKNKKEACQIYDILKSNQSGLPKNGKA